jgi:hypothetical protein
VAGEKSNMTLKTIGISMLVIALFVVLLTQTFVWIPDLFTDRVIVLGEMKTSGGDYFRVTQRFVGDGYLTRFDHTNKAGQSWHDVFDGDAFKAWRAQFEKTNDIVVIHVLNKIFFYNLATHAMTDANGRRRFVDEKAVVLTNSVDLFRVVTDAQSGQYAAVSADGRVIALKDRSGDTVWTNDVIAQFGTSLPTHEGEKIDSLEFIAGEIFIEVGKQFICIESQSGKVIRTGTQ